MWAKNSLKNKARKRPLHMHDLITKSLSMESFIGTRAESIPGMKVDMKCFKMKTKKKMMHNLFRKPKKQRKLTELSQRTLQQCEAIVQ